MADVARLLPRHWDGQRLLRFMAGLAMLALAFAAHAGLISTAPAVAAPVTVASATVTVAEAPAEPAPAEITSPPADIPPAVETLPRSVDLPASAAQSVHGSRAPPQY